MDDDLLMKYLTGHLGPEESESLRLSMESDPAIREYLEEGEKIWKSAGSILEFQSIDAAKDWISMRDRFGFRNTAAEHHPLRITRSMVFRMARVAAVLLLVMATSFLIYYYTGNGPMSRLEWTTMEARDLPGETTLPDGSKVSVNAGSQLVYPVDFKGRKRFVKLRGEAYFEVARNEKKAFHVLVADEASVEVLGTTFHIRQDPDKKRILLNVLSGRVAFFPKGKKKDALVIGPDEHAEFSSGNVRQQVSYDLNFLSWKTRTMTFDHTPLPEVLNQLARHYHKDFDIMHQGIDTLTLTGTYKNQVFEDVLDEISLVLDIIFEESNGRIQVKSFGIQANEE